MKYVVRRNLIPFLLSFFIGAHFLILFGCGVAGPTPLNVTNQLTTNTTPTPAEDQRNGFRPDGGFEISPYSPKSLREFVWLSVITGTGVGEATVCAPEPCAAPPIEHPDKWIPYPPKGMLVTRDNIYEWKTTDLSIDHFSFATELRKKIKYQFTGHFSVGGYYEKTKPDEIVLTGQLTKLVNGRSVAHEDVSFTWFGWDEVDSSTFRRLKPARRSR